MAPTDLPGPSNRPLLVTGVPRSGTTWLARQLAGSPGAALTGREPMNPHPGQYALGGTIDAWARLQHPTSRQERALRRAYRGLTPRLYGRYGHRQWAAPWPGTRIVVKDPFAVLSIGAVRRVTGALPVLVYRHPGAVLASYRRMGWSPDVTEIMAAVPGARASGAGLPGEAPVLAWFWATLNDVALADLADIPDAVVVAHEELAAGGEDAMARLFLACGLGRPPRSGAGGPTREPARPGRAARPGPNARGKTLHRLDRPASEVAGAWRSGIGEDDLAAMDALVGPTLAALRSRQLDLA
jgi:hypothetical protein